MAIFSCPKEKINQNWTNIQSCRRSHDLVPLPRRGLQLESVAARFGRDLRLRWEPHSRAVAQLLQLLCLVQLQRACPLRQLGWAPPPH